MKVYFSGWQATNREREQRVLDAGAVTHRCFSFVYVEPLPGLPFKTPGIITAYQANLDHGNGIMMDSGVFSYRSYRASQLKKRLSIEKMPTEEAYINAYVAYCKQHNKLWDFCVTIDIGMDCKANYARHVMLCKKGIDPVPVFHGDDELSYLDRYADLGHKLVCIGAVNFWLRTTSGDKRRYLDSVFQRATKLGLHLHGLAITSPWLMIGYPWWSVDASSWSRVAGFGSIMVFDPITTRMTTLHVSERASVAKGAQFKNNSKFVAAVKEQVEASGFDYEQLRTDFVARHIWNAKQIKDVAELADTRYRSGWDLLF